MVGRWKRPRLILTSAPCMDHLLDPSALDLTAREAFVVGAAVVAAVAVGKVGPLAFGIEVAQPGYC